MDKSLREFSYRKVCRIDILFLAVSWILALIFGLFFISHTNPFFSSLMCRIVYEPVSVVGLVCVLFVPLSISAVAVCCRNAVLIFLICDIRGFVLGCCLYSILHIFNSGGLFIAGLLMFSTVLFQIVLLWLWLRSLTGTICLKKDLIVCSAIAVLIGSLDYFCISPFLQVLIRKF